MCVVYVVRIPFVRGLNDEKGPMRGVETTRRGFEAAEFGEEGVQPDRRGGFPASKVRRGGSNRRKGPDEEFSPLTKGIPVQIVREGPIGKSIYTYYIYNT
jgi:hypothetical protein